MIEVSPRYAFRAPVAAECITPDSFVEKSLAEIRKLNVWEGNKRRKLHDLFKVTQNTESSSEHSTIRICGNVGKIRGIGAKMSIGHILIEGNAGMRLGEEMNGGKITVKGNADSWTGFKMKSGTITISGNVGDYIGAAYRGSTHGMIGGEIIVHGNAGNEIGCFMRNGLIKVYGNVGQFAGIHMQGGTIHVQGNSQGRTGAQMTQGKIVVCGNLPFILPTFTIDSLKTKVKVGSEVVQGPFYRFIGDLADNGKGKLFLSQHKNPQLRSFEEYL